MAAVFYTNHRWYNVGEDYTRVKLTGGRENSKPSWRLAATYV